MLPLTPEERARHAALSPLQAAWLDFVADRPEALQRAAFAELDAAAELEPEKVQPWPLFFDRAALAPLVLASRETLRLVKTVPERIFGGDPERMHEFYRLGEQVVRGAAALLADPGCREHLIGRGDFILGPEGFACCELNVAGNVGGWQVGPWQRRLGAHPLVAEFLETQGLRLRPLDPVETLLEHAVEVGLARGLAHQGELNLALLTAGHVVPALFQEAEKLYRAALARRAADLQGSVFVCTERQLTLDGGRARLDGRPVQLFVDRAMDLTDGPVFHAQAAGRGFAFNGMVSPLLSDKRNLALLSEQADGGSLYDAEERAAIARCIPWTRLLDDGFADRAGERIYLPDYVRAERERLVIKPADGLGGRNVFVGPSLAPAEWTARLDAALAEGGWIVQELVPSEPYLFQAREGGAAPHDLVWGAFVFGDRYGSCLVRGAARSGPESPAGVVNVERGARRIVLLEVEAAAQLSFTVSCNHEETRDAP